MGFFNLFKKKTKYDLDREIENRQVSISMRAARLKDKIEYNRKKIELEKLKKAERKQKLAALKISPAGKIAKGLSNAARSAARNYKTIQEDRIRQEKEWLKTERHNAKMRKAMGSRRRSGPSYRW